MKLNGEPDQQNGSSLGGQEDHSTQNSNNLDWNSKARRTTSGGASFTYNASTSGQPNDNGAWVTQPPSIFAVYQADLQEFSDKPRWFGHYHKENRLLVRKLKAFQWGSPIAVSELQSSLSMKNVHDQLHQVQDEDRKHSLLQFILLRNLLRLQSLGRAVIKMRNDAALKIQRTRRQLRS